MATIKKAAVKKELPKIVHAKLEGGTEPYIAEFAGCCGAGILDSVGDWCSSMPFEVKFKGEVEVKYVCIGEPEVSVTKMDAVLVEAVQSFLDRRVGLITATTILRSSRGVAPNSRSDQGIANLLLPQFGFTLVDKFRGNTGNLLGLWTRKRRGMKV